MSNSSNVQTIEFSRKHFRYELSPVDIVNSEHVVLRAVNVLAIILMNMKGSKNRGKVEKNLI